MPYIIAHSANHDPCQQAAPINNCGLSFVACSIPFHIDVLLHERYRTYVMTIVGSMTSNNKAMVFIISLFIRCFLSRFFALCVELLKDVFVFYHELSDVVYSGFVESISFGRFYRFNRNVKSIGNFFGC